MHNPGILGIGVSNPPRKYSQRQIYDLLAGYSPYYRNDRIRDLFMNSDIDSRHFWFDIESFRPGESRDELHERFLEGSVALSREAIGDCLKKSSVSAGDIDFIVAVSCTGYLCPGLSSLLIRDLGLRTNIQRADLLGMGCAGAMPGLQRAYDFVRAYPGKKALVICVEVCSACYYIDESLETVVGNAICSDGAAAVIVGSTDSTAVPKFNSFESLLEPSLIESVGFQHRDGYWRIVLSKDLRDIAGSLAATTISRLLSPHEVKNGDIDHWILHSGGRKVIDSLKKELALDEHQLRHSRHVLRTFGNMSSPTVLFVLKETLEQSRPGSGDTGLMLAMGPGLALEAALLQW